jgi:hypothetical protein
MTSSELLVTLLIWLLAGVGGFFWLRAAWRRRLAARQRRKARTSDARE